MMWLITWTKWIYTRNWPKESFFLAPAKSCSFWLQNERTDNGFKGVRHKCDRIRKIHKQYDICSLARSPMITNNWTPPSLLGYDFKRAPIRVFCKRNWKNISMYNFLSIKSIKCHEPQVSKGSRNIRTSTKVVTMSLEDPIVIGEN